MILKSFLTSQGLNDKDIQVYLDLFAHGQSFASTIALRCKLDRTTVYAVLKRLVNKGLIAQTKVGDVTAFIPLPAETFLQHLDQQISELDNKKQETVSFIEELNKVKKHNYHKPRIQIYEGDAAIISLYEQTVAQKGEQKAFLTLQDIPVEVAGYLKKAFIKNKLKNKVTSQVLVADSKYSQKYKDLDSKSNRQTKIVAEHPFSIHAEIILFNKREVAIIDFHEQAYGIVIESETLYKTIETLFDTIYNAA